MALKIKKTNQLIQWVEGVISAKLGTIQPGTIQVVEACLLVSIICMLLEIVAVLIFNISKSRELPGASLLWLI